MAQRNWARHGGGHSHHGVGTASSQHGGGDPQGGAGGADIVNHEDPSGQAAPFGLQSGASQPAGAAAVGLGPVIEPTQVGTSRQPEPPSQSPGQQLGRVETPGPAPGRRARYPGDHIGARGHSHQLDRDRGDPYGRAAVLERTDHGRGRPGVDPTRCEGVDPADVDSTGIDPTSVESTGVGGHGRHGAETTNPL